MTKPPLQAFRAMADRFDAEGLGKVDASEVCDWLESVASDLFIDHTMSSDESVWCNLGHHLVIVHNGGSEDNVVEFVLREPGEFVSVQFISLHLLETLFVEFGHECDHRLAKIFPRYFERLGR